MLADAGAPAVLALAGDAVMLADGSAPAVLDDDVHLLPWRLCPHFMHALCRALCRCIYLPLSLSPASRLPLYHHIVGVPTLLPSARSSRHSRHLPSCLACPLPGGRTPRCLLCAQPTVRFTGAVTQRRRGPGTTAWSWRGSAVRVAKGPRLLAGAGALAGGARQVEGAAGVLSAAEGGGRSADALATHGAGAV